MLSVLAVTPLTPPANAGAGSGTYPALCCCCCDALGVPPPLPQPPCRCMLLNDGRGDGLGLRNRPPPGPPGVGGPPAAGLGSNAGLSRTTSATNSAIHSAILLDTISSRPCRARVSIRHTRGTCALAADLLPKHVQLFMASLSCMLAQCCALQLKLRYAARTTTISPLQLV
jgi:hypothetical protein